MLQKVCSWPTNSTRQTGVFSDLAASKKDDYRVMYCLGKLGLLENRLQVAMHWFGRAATVGGGQVALAMEFLKQAVLAIDLSSKRFAVQTADPV